MCTSCAFSCPLVGVVTTLARLRLSVLKRKTPGSREEHGDCSVY